MVLPYKRRTRKIPDIEGFYLIWIGFRSLQALRSRFSSQLADAKLGEGAERGLPSGDNRDRSHECTPRNC